MMVRSRTLVWIGMAVVLVLGLALAARPSPPAQAAPAAAPPPAPASQGVSNDTCLACHQQPDLKLTLPSGEVLSLYVAPDVYAASIHGARGYACVQCHTDLRGYPHPAFTAPDRRAVTLQLNSGCRVCHSGQYEKTLDSAHDQARAAGNRAAAVCSDCHSAHATQPLTDPATHLLLPQMRTWIPTTCAQCHSTIYDKYKASVHGAALTDSKNLDVPTCIDCHGVHNMKDPTTNAFRIASPALCANCHTDPARMDKYKLSTQVLATYVSDFHGTTVTLFQKQSPDAPTNKAVCYDCHGVHDIQSTRDPQKGLAIRQNLLARCQVCHPGISPNFPDSWLSHYIPSPQQHPLVYYVNVFYMLFVPGVLGGMALLVGLDAFWRARQRLVRAPAAGPARLRHTLEGAAAWVEKIDKTKVIAKLVKQIVYEGEQEEPHE